MEKINLAKLLKDCPNGMELNCTIWDNVTFEGIEDIGYILIKTPNGQIKLSKEGCFTHYCSAAKCVIFPKGKTTWEGFVPPCQFKDGDVIWLNDGMYTYIAIFNSIESSMVKVYGSLHKNKIYLCEFLCNTTFINSIRLATESEKQKLFDAIKKNGYKWNDETKTLEKLIVPKFKAGDKITSKTIKIGINIITKVCENYYELDDGCTLKLDNQDEWELVPNKFDISTLKAFESRVLVRN